MSVILQEVVRTILFVLKSGIIQEFQIPERLEQLGVADFEVERLTEEISEVYQEEMLARY